MSSGGLRQEHRLAFSPDRALTFRAAGLRKATFLGLPEAVVSIQIDRIAQNLVCGVIGWPLSITRSANSAEPLEGQVAPWGSYHNGTKIF